MITLEARPRLAPKTKLRLDPKTEQYVLLYPEKGLVLNDTGAKIVRLCTGEHRVADIVAAMQAEHDQSDAATIEAEVLAFLSRLAGRGLVRSDG